jgi:GH18 family chitinase
MKSFAQIAAFAGVGFILLLLGGCLQQEASPTPSQTARFRVLAYVTEDTIPELIPYEKLTHINYAFVLPRPDGSLRDVSNGWKLRKIVETANQYGVKVLISVGGWGLEKEFEAIAADPAIRTVFVQNLVAYAAKYELHGVDIDWEYPVVGVSDGNYLALMRELRAALPQELLLTTAVPAYGQNADGFLAESFQYLDFVNLMVYDLSREAHATMAMAEQSLDYWQGRGLPVEKTVLGVPFYSRPGEVPYRKLVGANPAAAQVDAFEFAGAMQYYNGIPTMEAKTRLALERASGIMFWTLSHDTTDEFSLLAAIDRVVKSSQP